MLKAFSLKYLLNSSILGELDSAMKIKLLKEYIDWSQYS